MYIFLSTHLHELLFFGQLTSTDAASIAHMYIHMYVSHTDTDKHSYICL